jgi:competence protein ComEA
MQAAPPLAPTAAPPAQSAGLSAWPRSAQLTTAFLLGLVTALLAIHAYGSLRHSARPTEWEHASLTYQVDLNHADRAELLQLPGVGESLAARILDYRSKHNGFGQVEDLRKVRGVGPMTMEKLRPCVCVCPMDEIEEEPDAPVRVVNVARSAGQTPATTSARATGGKKVPGLDGPININRASVEELKQLPGIGPTLSQRIVDARRQKPFQSVDDLRRVRGIGPKIFASLKPYITVGSDRVTVAVGE